MMLRFTLVLAGIITLPFFVNAQIRIGNPEKKVADTIKPDTTVKRPATPKPYDKVITRSALTRKGLFTVHKIEEAAGIKWFFEIPDSLLGRDILVVNRLTKAPVDNHPEDREKLNMMGYAGDLINQTLIRIEKAAGHKIFIRSISYSVNPDSTSPMFHSVMNSNIQPITHALDIKTYGQESFVVDMTPLLDREDRLFSFGIKMKELMELGAQKNDRTYVADIKTFPSNVEIQVVRTYDRTTREPGVVGVARQAPGLMITESAAVSTLEINTSIILLSREPMRPRYHDARVGFFAAGYVDFDSDPQGTKTSYMVTRWRLEPKPEDVEKYRKGELVEPARPIIFYIDPATPKQWVPYLIKGVNDWQKAFEKAGFKNAIIGKTAPTENPNWSLEDARYSAIVYKPSTISNASGPHIHDPRSGEILESHVNWYHDVMKLAHDWYMIQAGPSDTAARHAKFSDELMGELIRFVCSHEIGHALGLRHNFGASNATPVEKLRNKNWLKEHGHTASIMDYARFNYVAQPEDSVGLEGLFPRINDYDLWAIEWGYKQLFVSGAEERSVLSKTVTTRITNPRLRFISGEGVLVNTDPRAQTEDLGDDAMKANAYGIKNLQYVMAHLPEWTRTTEGDYSTLSRAFGGVLNQYLRYINHVFTYIGGIYQDAKTSNDVGETYTPVPKQFQKQALQFLGKEIFQYPAWLFDGKVVNNVLSPKMDYGAYLATTQFNHLFGLGLLSRFSAVEERGGKNIYTLDEYLHDVHDIFWTELSRGKEISTYRKMLQNMYVTQLVEFTTPHDPAFYLTSLSGITKAGSAPSIGYIPNLLYTDVPVISKSLLKKLRTQILAALPAVTNRMTKMHLDNILGKIDTALKKG